MAIKHVTTKHYKENIETKTKKLDDESVTLEQRKVIRQDLDKLKEKHKNHVKAVEKDFDEQIKAAPKEVKKELENKKAAFKSKYVVKEDEAETPGANTVTPGANTVTPGAETNNNTEAIKEDVVKEAIKNGKYYGFKNLTVQKFVNAKNINIEKVSLDGPSVADFYNENKGYKWINKPDKTTNCKKAICKNIINMDDISQVINYENLGINKEDNKDCYTSDGSDRVLFDTEATIMNYWEEDCSKILQSEGIA